ncbi:hypothetical protein BDK92_5951 [Micromonospora pisi]|uniref:Uncharacterized protein n=1 Tax=Micromonospora pisi TaxID=589240 RepID=A0A495JRS7_9ACTN|nr:hypothetical protein BDK92_5951 [Micromonospora pisi]
MAGARPLLRLLLLVAVAFGVASMHTLGHVSGERHASAGRNMSMAPTSHAVGDRMTALDGFTVAPMDTATVRVGWVRAGDGGGSGVPHGDPLSVCLAILTALGMAVLVAAALRAIWSPSLIGSDVVYITSPSRAPPRLRVGLRIADLSVSRT